MVYHRSSRGSSQGETEPKNTFRNDGSFLEMFKKMQEKSTASSSDSPKSESCSKRSPVSSSPPCVKNELVSQPNPVSEISTESQSIEKSQTPDSEGKPTLNNKFPIVGKRRGGRALPTGQVKKLKADVKEEPVAEPKDAWSQYLAEVKKYREAACEEEGKTRPLVK